MLSQGMQPLVTRDDAGETVTLLYGSTFFFKISLSDIDDSAAGVTGVTFMKAPFPPFIESFFFS